jgi:hypothetical protein
MALSQPMPALLYLPVHLSTLILACNWLQGCQSVAWHEVICQESVECVQLRFSACTPARLVALLLTQLGQQLPHRAQLAWQFMHGFCQHACYVGAHVMLCGAVCFSSACQGPRQLQASLLSGCICALRTCPVSLSWHQSRTARGCWRLRSSSKARPGCVVCTLLLG